ncbi:MAG: pantoate--beta-alanine ligase [Dehalococcoidia bacterium]
MQVIKTVAAMHSARLSMQSPVAVVPTLGGLHAGHEALLHAARERAESVVATLFLNPKQFGENEDLERYPADRDRDLAIMQSAGVNAVFAPSVDEIYPPGDTFTVNPGPIGDVLEGAQRPGHFRAVATVVAKLFNATRPDLAYFGEKDAQQLEVVRRMAHDLGFEIEVVPVKTVRDENGVALSSRLAYLSEKERVAAEIVYTSLRSARDRWANRERAASALESTIRTVIQSEPLATLNYAAVIDPETFEPHRGPIPSTGALALVAVRIGTTRLIDNLRLN